MNRIEKSGKSIEEALVLALVELGATIEEVDYEVLDAPSKAIFGLIGGKEARVVVTRKKADPVQVARDFLTRVFEAMRLRVHIEKITNEDSVTLNLRGEDLGILIGKHGQTLDALQYLTNIAAHRESSERMRIVVDVEDYRRRRADTLQQLAQRLCERVKRSGQQVVLEPMNPLERKIIHVSLQDDPEIRTFSEGEEPYRHVVIAFRG